MQISKQTQRLMHFKIAIWFLIKFDNVRIKLVIITLTFYFYLNVLIDILMFILFTFHLIIEIEKFYRNHNINYRFKIIPCLFTFYVNFKDRKNLSEFNSEN